jgi:long-chain acyl-CoA synthetase
MRPVDDSLRTPVDDVVVVGVEDAEFGQRVHAFVQLATGVEPDTALEDALAAHARAKLAGFKVPRGWTFLDDFPRVPSGKVLRRRLPVP